MSGKIKIKILFWSILVLTGVMLSACLSNGTKTADDSGKPRIFAAYPTSLEEPWILAIHTALLNIQEEGRINYTWQDGIGYQGDMERVLREVVESDSPPNIIIGDGPGNEDTIYQVAAEHPEIAFVFSSTRGPAEPNLSVFSNWIYEAAYLAGLIAGNLTETGTIGVVSSFPVPEINANINAFIQGARETNPDVKVKITFINSWYDPPAAKRAALDQILAGADIIFAERVGAEQAAEEKGVLAIGYIQDQYDLAPAAIVTSVVWNTEPTINHVLEQVKAGTYTAQDLRDFSGISKGGASLAPFYEHEDRLSGPLKKLIQKRQLEIQNGLFQVNLDENMPVSD